MTLRYINADEIASNMLDVLGNKEFQSIHKKASFSKKANDEEALKEALEELDFDDKEGFGEVANEDLEIEEPMDEEDFEEENYWGKPDTSEEEGDDERLNDEIREEEEAGRDKILDDDLYKTHPELGRQFAEKWVNKRDVNFFYHNLHEIYPELGSQLAEEIAKSNGRSFFLHGLDKMYPEWKEVAAETEDDFKEATDFATEAALKFTKKNLVKLSNLLDSKGFAGIASILDNTIVCLSEKKRTETSLLKKAKDDQDYWTDTRGDNDQEENSTHGTSLDYFEKEVTHLAENVKLNLDSLLTFSDFLSEVGPYELSELQDRLMSLNKFLKENNIGSY